VRFFGSEITSWGYLGVVEVQIHTGMMSGAVIVQTPGQAGASTSFWNTGDSAAYRAPNAIPVTRPWDQVQAGVARLRQLLEEAHRSTRSSGA
jgi:hypothetical protein